MDMTVNSPTWGLIRKPGQAAVEETRRQAG